MKQAVHFGAGNIGRGFIGEVLKKNDFEIAFVDVNETIIDALNARHEYSIEIADPNHEKIQVSHVRGINNRQEADQVIEAIAQADLVTTAIGPNILPHIAELIARGIQLRAEIGKTLPLDVVACENMIGGSAFLKRQVLPFLANKDQIYLDQWIGFPNAAVDRIVPNQTHDDVLLVTVEPFREWVVDESQLKNPNVKLEGVHYAPDLEPFIERKLFSVNSGHATVAYTGAYFGHQTILEALQDERVLEALKAVQKETRSLLLEKWDFKEDDLIAYHDTIIARFTNPEIVDEISRVGRTPIRKLGYDERFIRPIRELSERNLPFKSHLDVVGKVFAYQDPEDPESVHLQEELEKLPLREVVAQVTGLSDQKLLPLIEAVIQEYRR